MKRTKLSLALRNALSAGVVVGLAAPYAYGQQAAADAGPGTQIAQQSETQVAQQDTSTTASQVAQQTPPPAAQQTPPPTLLPVPQRIEKIEVTGSRIPISPNLTSTSPITQLTNSYIQLTGLTDTQVIVDQLPMAYTNQNANVTNGGSGTASVNLRNLGPARTLVLIDGRRLPPGNPLYWATDLNNIPAPLIDRVEVLTGGASAIYGSDAVAGVVNFIMNDHFEGVQFQYNGQGYNHQQHNNYASAVAAKAATNPAQYAVPGNNGLNGEIQDFNMVLGSNFANGKGNATIYFEYRHTTPVTQGQYDYSACALGSSPNRDSVPLTCASGSGTSYPGRFVSQGGQGLDYTIANAAGDVRRYISATDAFNFAPYQFYQTQGERYIANAFTHYDVTPNARVYGEFDFADNDTLQQLAPGGVFGQGFTLLDTNPLLSQSFKNAMGITAATPGNVLIFRRNTEGGGRQYDTRNTFYRYVLGVKGDILDGKWDYDFWWQSGKVIFSQTQRNQFTVTKIGNALNVVSDPNGRPVCQSTLDGTDPRCVPYDIFHIGGVTPAAINYLGTPTVENGSTQQSVVGLHLTSDLGEAYGWRSPWATDGVGLAFGLERRVEKLTLTPDETLASGDVSGSGGPTLALNGQYTVLEPFVELRVPIMQEKPWAYLFDFAASYRYSNYYTLNETTNSFGLGGRWAPVKGYTFRGSYQQASRAPNVVELFTQQGFNLFGGSDPCGGPVPSATLAQCLRTGLPANLYGSALLTSPAGQYQYLQGGNPNLTPETSKSYTLGIVLTPLPKFNASVDYWNIKVSNAVGLIQPSLSISQCIAVGQFCDLIHRNTVNGTLWLGNGFVTGTNVNIGAYKTSGWDVSLNYVYDLPKTWGTWGSLLFYFVGTYVDQFSTTPVPGQGSYDCVGLFGPTCLGPQPRWRNTFRTTWSTAWNWDLALTWRYFGEVALDAAQSNPLLAGQFSTASEHMGQRNYIDIAGNWNINKNWTLRAGVNNIFDRDPPIVSNAVATTQGFGSGNTYPGTYDCCGRTLFVSLTAKF